MPRAVEIEENRYRLSSRAFVDVSVWRLPHAQVGCSHNFKYRLALIIDGTCVMRYDNEAGKGDHWHSGRREMPYRFAGIEELMTDFWGEVEKRRQQWDEP